MNKSIQFFGLFRREVRRYFKVSLQTLGAPIVNSALYLLIFGVSLGRTFTFDQEVPYLAFLIPGLIAMAFIRGIFENSTSAIMSQKYVNELQDLRSAPLSIGQICLSKTIASLTRGCLVGVLTLIVGEIFYLIEYKELLGIAAPGVLAFFLLFGGLAFGSLGVAIGMVSRNFEHVGAISALVLLPLIYLGGVFFDLSKMHPFWQTLSHFNPLFYIISGVRYGMLGIDGGDLKWAAGLSFLFFIFCYILALLSLKRGARYSR